MNKTAEQQLDSLRAVEPGLNGAPEDADNTGATRHDFPSFRRILLIMPSIFMCLFLAVVDRTIIGTAIPKITDDFHSIDDVGWYASAYLLTNCSFQLLYGRVYTLCQPKYVLLTAIAIFETGSAISGAAGNSKVFIIGRAISGLGSAGIFGGCTKITIDIIPLQRRPNYQALAGATFGLASIIGPIIGGAWVTHVSWRWCFFMNLPIGAAATVLILLFVPKTSIENTNTIMYNIRRMDPLGTIVFLPGVVCLLLALQWAGTTYPWRNAHTIVLLVCAAISLALFTWLQSRQGDDTTIPIRIITQRSVASSVAWSVLSPGSMMVLVFYLPLWFQVIKGVSAVQSGVDTLPMVFALMVGTAVASRITSTTGYYVPQLIASSIIMTCGASLLTTLRTDESPGKWIGYQIIYGFGLGLGMQQASIAVQTCLNKQDVMIGSSLMFFMQSLGGSVFIAISQTVFINSLISKLPEAANINSSMVLNNGATEILDVVPPFYHDQVLEALNSALSDVFKVGAACAGATIVAGVSMEWKNIKGLNQGGAEGEAERNTDLALSGVSGQKQGA